MNKMISVLLAIFLLFLFPLTIFGVEPKIVDNAQLLTADEASKLEEAAQTLADTYEIDVVILTVDSLNGNTAVSYADDYFDYNGYGLGSDDSGVLFLLAMQEREWYVSTHADGNSAVTYDEIGDISDQILSDLSSGNYYDAFSEYLDLLEDEFYDYRNAPAASFDFFDVAFRLLIALLIGAAIAGIVLLVMRGKMNTAKPQSGARSYMVNGTYDLYRHQDIFLYSQTSRTRKAENNSGGGGGTHRSSSGRSHGGRGGRF